MAEPSDSGTRSLSDSLFSTDAADYAEVVPDDLPKGPESLWATGEPTTEEAAEDANPFGHERWSTSDGRPWADPWSTVPDPLIEPGVGTGPAPHGANGAAAGNGASSSARNGSGFGLGEPAPSTNGFSAGYAAAPTAAPPGDGSVFSSDPVGRSDDVLDADEVEEFDEVDDLWEPPHAASTGSVFSSGAPPFRPPVHAEPDPPAARRPHSAPPRDPWGDWAEPMRETVQDVPPEPPSYVAPEPDRHTGGSAGSGWDDVGHQSAASPDPQGFDRAVSRLSRDDSEQTHVPLAVCGALLLPGEQVTGVVTGQMLGRPAAVVVTNSRVIVANDRRWQPIVDIYEIGPRLTVRGRHDRQIAALSFADDERLSMVDGITEVELAIGLVESIRHPGASERGGASQF